MRLHLPAAALFLLTLPAITLAQTPTPTPLTQWRAAYAARLAQPDGWLALVALQWLQDGDTSVGSAPGNKLVLPHTPAHLGQQLHTATSSDMKDWLPQTSFKV